MPRGQPLLARAQAVQRPGGLRRRRRPRCRLVPGPGGPSLAWALADRPTCPAAADAPSPPYPPQTLTGPCPGGPQPGPWPRGLAAQRGPAWRATVHGVTKSPTRLSDFPFTFHFHALEKEMATHSSVLAWRIPGTAEPGGLLSMGSVQRGHGTALPSHMWHQWGSSHPGGGQPGCRPRGLPQEEAQGKGLAWAHSEFHGASFFDNFLFIICTRSVQNSSGARTVPSSCWSWSLGAEGCVSDSLLKWHLKP